MGYQKGLVSVIMPTYKRADKLVRAIDSILNQTYSNLELLLVNDNEPTDEFTGKLMLIAEKYVNDTRFKLIMQERHINGAVARNKGIECAKGEYIAFLDDDDWWKADKIEKQVKVLSNLDNSWGCVSCRIERFDNDKLIARLPQYKDGYVYKDILMLQSDFATGSLLFRHKALDITGYFDINLMRHQDLQLLVNFTYKFKLKQLDECLHCCDISDNQNRPKGDSLRKCKMCFFKSISFVMSTLSPKEQNSVYALHNFELCYVYFKEQNIFMFLKYFVSVLTRFSAYPLIVKKIKQKLKTRIL